MNPRLLQSSAAMYRLCIAVCIWILGADGFYISDHIRQKRQYAGYTAPPKPLELPAGFKPYPGTSHAESLTPTFPMAHTYSNGLDVNQGNINFVEGTLNVPIPGWGMWDLKARQIAGPQTTWMNYGHMVQPVNMFNMTPSEMADMVSSPAYQEARAGSRPEPVISLPGGFVPANCRPPMCNPFIHQTAAGVQALPGNKNRQYDGLLDFPVPTGRDGANVRFPLQGNFMAGKSPYMYTHGHVINPVNPFKNYKPGGSDTDTTDSSPGRSLLEQTNSQTAFSRSSSVDSMGPSDLPPLPRRRSR